MKCLLKKCVHERTISIKGWEYCVQCKEPTGQKVFKDFPEGEQLNQYQANKIFRGLIGTFSTGYSQDANKNLPIVHDGEPTERS